MIRKSVRAALIAVFVLVNLALVARPAGAGWTEKKCLMETDDWEYCCVRCIFCLSCDIPDVDINVSDAMLVGGLD